MSIELRDLMKTTPKQLASLQHDTLKKHVLDVLDRVKNIIDDEQYHILLSNEEKYLQHSPDGDGYGSDNYYIDFSYDEDEPMDISEVLEELLKLSNIVEEN